MKHYRDLFISIFYCALKSDSKYGQLMGTVCAGECSIAKLFHWLYCLEELHLDFKSQTATK